MGTLISLRKVQQSVVTEDIIGSTEKVLLCCVIEVLLFSSVIDKQRPCLPAHKDHRGTGSAASSWDGRTSLRNTELPLPNFAIPKMLRNIIPSSHTIHKNLL